MLVGRLRDEGKSCLLLNCEDTALFIAGALEISKFMSQLLFSLPLLQESCSVSFFMHLTPPSLVSILFRAINCIISNEYSFDKIENHDNTNLLSLFFQCR